MAARPAPGCENVDLEQDPGGRGRYRGSRSPCLRPPPRRGCRGGHARRRRDWRPRRPKPPTTSGDSASDATRREQAYRQRVDAAKLARQRPHVAQSPNGDEDRYPNRIASYSKGLPHDGLGEVDPHAYDTLLRAFRSGDPSDFEQHHARARPEADEPAGGPRVRSRGRGLASPRDPGRRRASTAPRSPARRRSSTGWRFSGTSRSPTTRPTPDVAGRRERSLALLDLPGPEGRRQGDARRRSSAA